MSGFRHITVYLDDENADFLKWLSRRDNVSSAEELRMIFWAEFDQCEDLYFDEYKASKEG